MSLLIHKVSYHYLYYSTSTVLSDSLLPLCSYPSVAEALVESLAPAPCTFFGSSVLQSTRLTVAAFLAPVSAGGRPPIEGQDPTPSGEAGALGPLRPLSHCVLVATSPPPPHPPRPPSFQGHKMCLLLPPVSAGGCDPIEGQDPTSGEGRLQPLSHCVLVATSPPLPIPTPVPAPLSPDVAPRGRGGWRMLP